MYPYVANGQVATPKTMEELQAMMVPGGALNPYPKQTPAMVPQYQPQPQLQTPQFVTAQDVQAMIDASLKQTAQVAASPLAQFDTIFQRALPSEDFAAFTAYVQNGAPGFADLLQTDKLDPIAQLLWETIKENIK